jgi:hypothetical protein
MTRTLRLFFVNVRRRWREWFGRRVDPIVGESVVTRFRRLGC